MVVTQKLLLDFNRDSQKNCLHQSFHYISLKYSDTKYSFEERKILKAELSNFKEEIVI